MNLDFSTLDLPKTTYIKYVSKKCPFFLVNPPYGEGTGEIEAITSYICRQAEQVCEWAHSYTTRLLEWTLSDGELPKDRQVSTRDTHAYNSIGIAEQRLSKALVIATQGKIDPSLMTLRCLENLTDLRKHGLMRDHIAWCSTCWKQDMKSGGRPYLRLYWTLQHTKICIKHNEILKSACPNCNSTKHQFPSFPRQWICDKCGNILFEGAQDRWTQKVTDRDRWFSNSVHRLLEVINRDGFRIDESSVPNAFSRVIETTKLTINDLASELQIRPRRLKGIIEGKRRPYFPAFMDLCYRMDIPPHELLFNSGNLTNPDNWRHPGKTTFVSMSKLSQKDKVDLKAELDRAIKSEEIPPPQVSKIALKFGIKYTTIQQNFEEEYRILAGRRVRWERQSRKTRHQKRIETLCDGIFNLVKSGKYPCERALREIAAVRPHELRRKDLKLILSAFQQVYSEQDLIDEEILE